jgi:hypothetical protein
VLGRLREVLRIVGEIEDSARGRRATGWPARSAWA